MATQAIRWPTTSAQTWWHCWPATNWPNGNHRISATPASWTQYRLTSNRSPPSTRNTKRNENGHNETGANSNDENLVFKLLPATLTLTTLLRIRRIQWNMRVEREALANANSTTILSTINKSNCLRRQTQNTCRNVNKNFMLSPNGAQLNGRTNERREGRMEGRRELSDTICNWHQS